jgi:hypothetical protein
MRSVENPMERPMRRILVVALMSAGLLAANAAGSTAEAWSDRGHGGGYSRHGGYGYGHHGYGRPYYAPSYGYSYRPYYPQWRHHHRHTYRPYTYGYGYGW